MARFTQRHVVQPVVNGDLHLTLHDDASWRMHLWESDIICRGGALLQRTSFLKEWRNLCFTTPTEAADFFNMAANLQ